LYTIENHNSAIINTIDTIAVSNAISNSLLNNSVFLYDKSMSNDELCSQIIVRLLDSSLVCNEENNTVRNNAVVNIDINAANIKLNSSCVIGVISFCYLKEN
jgi:hypothetical protein